MIRCTNLERVFAGRTDCVIPKGLTNQEVTDRDRSRGCECTSNKTTQGALQ